MLERLNSQIYYYYYKIFINRSYRNRTVYERDESFSYETLLGGLNIPDGSKVFIHAGIKSIKGLSGDNSVDVVKNLINTIKQEYSPNAIIAPAFTPSFRTSGIYSKMYSKAEYGAFAEIFRAQAHYRTDDAIHGCSIITEDIKQFVSLDYNESFGKNGFYNSLVQDTYILNVSTNYFVSTYLHYLENDLCVPYKKMVPKWCGVTLTEENQAEEKEQINHAYYYNTVINRDKLISKLRKKQVIVESEHCGVSVSAISVRKLDEIIRSEIVKNPYFLVTL
jgi:aminoglycoside N3'-acetyltransferase